MTPLLVAIRKLVFNLIQREMYDNKNIGFRVYKNYSPSALDGSLPSPP